MTARSCPTCRSVGPPRMVGEDVGYLALCVDVWHDPSPDTGGAMVSTASLPKPGIYDPGHGIAAAQARQEAAERECAALRAEVAELQSALAAHEANSNRARRHMGLIYAAMTGGPEPPVTVDLSQLAPDVAEHMEELRQLRVEVDDARVIVERRGRIIADMRATGSELIVARDAALAEVDRLRGLLDDSVRKNIALFTEQYEVDQILGKALGCPEGFPVVNLVDDGSVETGEHTIVSLAHAAAKRITGEAP